MPSPVRYLWYLDFASPVTEMFTCFCYTNLVLMALRNVTEVILKCMHWYGFSYIQAFGSRNQVILSSSKSRIKACECLLNQYIVSHEIIPLGSVFKNFSTTRNICSCYLSLCAGRVFGFLINKVA